MIPPVSEMAVTKVFKIDDLPDPVSPTMVMLIYGTSPHIFKGSDLNLSLYSFST